MLSASSQSATAHVSSPRSAGNRPASRVSAAAWPRAAATQTMGDCGWSDFDASLAEHVRTDFPDLPPDALALALRMWGRMHGLIALEVYGHLRPQTQDPAKLFRAELRDLVRSLGF
ncbi:TetR-like C-terminal domain-containing protein [Nocardia abscessus]|nr:TetR-like C-terminal domain-containing protein [Nocardia abscessus]